MNTFRDSWRLKVTSLLGEGNYCEANQYLIRTERRGVRVKCVLDKITYISREVRKERGGGHGDVVNLGKTLERNRI